MGECRASLVHLLQVFVLYMGLVKADAGVELAHFCQACLGEKMIARVRGTWRCLDRAQDMAAARPFSFCIWAGIVRFLRLWIFRACVLDK